jgi:hypothetical protein
VKPRLSYPRAAALTKIEVVIIVAVIVFFPLVLLPATMSANKGARPINCLNNLKQISLAHQPWMGDQTTSFRCRH